jgi:hypothetical protein
LRLRRRFQNLDAVCCPMRLGTTSIMKLEVSEKRDEKVSSETRETMRARTHSQYFISKSRRSSKVGVTPFTGKLNTSLPNLRFALRLRMLSMRATNAYLLRFKSKTAVCPLSRQRTRSAGKSLCAPPPRKQPVATQAAGAMATQTATSEGPQAASKMGKFGKCAGQLAAERVSSQEVC